MEYEDRRSSAAPLATKKDVDAAARKKMDEGKVDEARYCFTPVVGITIGVVSDIAADPIMELGEAVEIRRKDQRTLVVPDNKPYFQKLVNKAIRELRKSKPFQG